MVLCRCFLGAVLDAANCVEVPNTQNTNVHLHTCILVLPKLILFLPNVTTNLLVACKYKASPLDPMGLLVES